MSDQFSHEISFLLLPPAAVLIDLALSVGHKLDSRAIRRFVSYAVVVACVLLLLFNGFLVSLGVGGLVQRLFWLTVVVWFFVLAKSGSGVTRLEAK